MRLFFICLNILNRALSFFDINWFSVSFIVSNLLELMNLSDLLNIAENADTSKVSEDNKNDKYFWYYVAASVAMIIIIIVIQGGVDSGPPPSFPLSPEEKFTIMRETLEACRKKS